MEKFFKEIEKKVYEAIKNDARHILEQTKNETIYAVSLVTDEDCVSIFLAVNTYEYLSKHDLKTLDSNRKYLSDKKIKQVEDGTGTLTKWVAHGCIQKNHCG